MAQQPVHFSAEWVPDSGTYPAEMCQAVGGAGASSGSKTTTGVSASREAA